jgi:hypothetical protein
MKYAIAIPAGMVLGFIGGGWLTGYPFPDKSPNGNFTSLVLLGFMVAGGLVAAVTVSSPWWDRRQK